VKKILACAALALLTAACDRGGGTPTDPSQVNIEFTVTDIVVGSGTEAVNGTAATVNYAGWLYNPAGPDSKGVLFTNAAGEAPLTVAPLGTAQILPGFQQAIRGMKVGGRRRAYIPSSLAYGSAGRAPQIPGNAALVFEIELLTVQ
jgi:FKBP-type peptidyl-prolyl cis-trans isomerase FkpA